MTPARVLLAALIGLATMLLSIVALYVIGVAVSFFSSEDQAGFDPLSVLHGVGFLAFLVCTFSLGALWFLRRRRA